MNRQQRRSTERRLRKGTTITLNELISSAVMLHKEGHIVEAEGNYQAIIKAFPQHPDAYHFLGVLHHQRGESAEAIRLIQQAIDILPTYTDAYNNLGNIYKETGDLNKAVECYQKIIESVPNHAPALSNLGIVLRHIGDYDAAIKVLWKATELEPNNACFFQNLGNAYRKQGDVKQATIALRQSIALQPYQSEAYVNLWRTLYMEQRYEEAADVLRQWLTYDPENPIALHILAAHLGGDNVPDRASDAYVQQTFDDFAGSFDQVLARLDYRAPELVVSAVSHLYGEATQTLKILDAGCGTGLCGPLLKPYAATLFGVDLSPKMLAKATGRNVYDALIALELVTYLEQHVREFDLIVSADTLVYFGELRPFLHAAKKALILGGHLVFTLEKNQGELNFILNGHGRYSHTKAYIEAVLIKAGFKIMTIDDVTPRKEGGKPVFGLLVTAELENCNLNESL